MTYKVARLAAVASMSVTMLAVVPATAPANTPSASIQFASNRAQLQGLGIVGVSLYYQCNPSALSGSGFINLQLEQFGHRGQVVEGAKCDDQKHKAALEVPGPFSPGTATAHALVGNNQFTSHAEASAELTVR